jgi:hypothetical protein
MVGAGLIDQPVGNQILFLNPPLGKGLIDLAVGNQILFLNSTLGARGYYKPKLKKNKISIVKISK